jgi:hypothetical protein
MAHLPSSALIPIPPFRSRVRGFKQGMPFDMHGDIILPAMSSGEGSRAGRASAACRCRSTKSHHHDGDAD